MRFFVKKRAKNFEQGEGWDYIRRAGDGNLSVGRGLAPAFLPSP